MRSARQTSTRCPTSVNEACFKTDANPAAESPAAVLVYGGDHQGSEPAARHQSSLRCHGNGPEHRKCSPTVQFGLEHVCETQSVHVIITQRRRVTQGEERSFQSQKVSRGGGQGGPSHRPPSPVMSCMVMRTGRSPQMVTQHEQSSCCLFPRRPSFVPVSQKRRGSCRRCHLLASQKFGPRELDLFPPSTQTSRTLRVVQCCRLTSEQELQLPL